MLTNISYHLILGKPVIMYLGIVVFILLLSTAAAGVMVLRGKAKRKTHLLLVKIAITLALVHGILGILAYF